MNRCKNFLEHWAYNVVSRLLMLSFLRKLMRRKRRHTIVSFISLWLIFVVGLGTSFAGISACSPDFPECVVVTPCCAGMHDSAMPGTGGSSDTLAGPGDCVHEGICIDGFQPIDISAVNGCFQYDISPSRSLRGSLVSMNYPEVMTIILQEPSSENYPSVFLLNCSFLI